MDATLIPRDRDRPRTNPNAVTLTEINSALTDENLNRVDPRTIRRVVIGTAHKSEYRVHPRRGPGVVRDGDPLAE